MRFESFAYDTSGWGNFFVAEVGASAALAGLLFVAVSISLSKVLSVPYLPNRALGALVLLFQALLIASCGLVPGESIALLGGEIGAIGVVTWLVLIWIQRGNAHHPSVPKQWFYIRLIGSQLATLPMLIAAGSLLAGRGGGLYWVVPGMAFSLLAAIFNAWVLLVEIHR